MFVTKKIIFYLFVVLARGPARAVNLRPGPRPGRAALGLARSETVPGRPFWTFYCFFKRKFNVQKVLVVKKRVFFWNLYVILRDTSFDLSSLDHKSGFKERSKIKCKEFLLQKYSNSFVYVHVTRAWAWGSTWSWSRSLALGERLSYFIFKNFT